MRRFTIEIAANAFEALAELALRERRAVRDQAAVVLEQALARERRPRAAEPAPTRELAEVAR
jgi:hypothetical protein